MATYYSNSNNTYRLRLEVTNRDGNSATNQSVVDYSFYLEQTSKRFNGLVQTGNLTINGVSLYTAPTSFNSTQYSFNSSILLKSGSLTVSHTSDGSKTVPLVANYSANSGGNGPVGLAINDTFVLTTIPRASQPSLNVSTQALGSSITIYTNRSSDSFTHTLTYAFGNQSGTIGTVKGVTTSQAWTLPVGLASAIPNATSGTGTITCQTYNGNTLIGSKSVSFIATVPNNSTFQPTATISSIVQGTTLPSGITVFVQNQSKAKVTSTGTGKYSATIKTYSVSVAGIGTYTGSVITSAFLRNSGSVRVTLTVTDSRGLKGSTYQDITVVAYSPPQLPTFNASRSESIPSDIRASFNASISPIDNQNNRYFRIRSKASDGGWVIETDTTQNYTFSGTQYIMSNPDKSYTIEFFVQDSFTSVTQTVQVGTAFTLIDFNTSGKGMAIGKVSESNSFEVAMPATFTDGITSNGGGNIAPSTTAYNYSQGLLVDICEASLYNMVTVNVIGNGYGEDIPIHSIFQVYHYTPSGTLMFPRQTNISGNLQAGKFLIDGGRLKLWFPQSGAYQTIIINAYGMNGIPYKVSVSNVAEPPVEQKTTCALIKTWNDNNSEVIVDRGSNPNGTYIRFSDGVQICYNAYLPSSNNDTTGTLVTFPATFYDNNYIANASTRGHVSGSTFASYVVEFWAITNSTCRIKILVHGPTNIDGTGNPNFGYIAIGRWK